MLDFWNAWKTLCLTEWISQVGGFSLFLRFTCWFFGIGLHISGNGTFIPCVVDTCDNISRKTIVDIIAVLIRDVSEAFPVICISNTSGSHNPLGWVLLEITCNCGCSFSPLRTCGVFNSLICCIISGKVDLSWSGHPLTSSYSGTLDTECQRHFLTQLSLKMGDLHQMRSLARQRPRRYDWHVEPSEFCELSSKTSIEVDSDALGCPFADRTWCCPSLDRPDVDILFKLFCSPERCLMVETGDGHCSILWCQTNNAINLIELLEKVWVLGPLLGWLVIATKTRTTTLVPEPTMCVCGSEVTQGHGCRFFILISPSRRGRVCDWSLPGQWQRTVYLKNQLFRPVAGFHDRMVIQP